MSKSENSCHCAIYIPLLWSGTIRDNVAINIVLLRSTMVPRLQVSFAFQHSLKGWSATMTDGQQSTKTARTESDESDNRSSMSPVENGTARVMRYETEALDDQGTSQEEAAEILQILRD